MVQGSDTCGRTIDTALVERIEEVVFIKPVG